MRLLINNDTEPACSTDVVTQVEKFRWWLTDYQPGFSALPESEQKNLAGSYFDQYARSGRLPPLPKDELIIPMTPGKKAIPNAKINDWVQNLETQLVQTFLHDTQLRDNLQWIEDTISTIVDKKVDQVVAGYLTYPLIYRANKLNGIYQILQNLIHHSIRYSLEQARFRTPDLKMILNVVSQISLNDGYRLVRVYGDQSLVEEFIAKFDPYISNNSAEMCTDIKDTIRKGCSLDTLYEMIYDRIYSLLSNGLNPDIAYDFNQSPMIYKFEQLFIPDNQSLSHKWYDDIPAVSNPHLESRLRSLETMTNEEHMELYLRVFMPKTTMRFYATIKDVFLFITQPENLWTIANKPQKRIKGRCTQKDIQVITL